MKICVLGTGILAEEFKELEYAVIDCNFLDFDVEDVANYDVIINTYNYKCDDDGKVDPHSMIACNVVIPAMLSKYCSDNHKRYVHMSTSALYPSTNGECTEKSQIWATDAYISSKILAETVCGKKDLVIRTDNIFNDAVSTENALYSAIINSTPHKNVESFSWTVDIIRGIVSLLRSKQHGVYNLTSQGVESQATICEKVGITNIAPTMDMTNKIYNIINIDKSMEHIIPMNVMDNIPKCFESLKLKLGE